MKEFTKEFAKELAVDLVLYVLNLIEIDENMRVVLCSTDSQYAKGLVTILADWFLSVNEDEIMSVPEDDDNGETED